MDEIHIAANALGAQEITDENELRALRQKVRGATAFFRNSAGVWGLFIQSGHLAEVELKGMKESKRHDVTPVVFATRYGGIDAIAEDYPNVLPHVIFRIAGQHCLIAPPGKLPRTTPKAIPHATRVQTSLLEVVAGHSGVSSLLRKRFRTLLGKYRRIEGMKQSERDSAEHTALIAFAKQALTDMGLDSSRLKLTEFVRTIETSDLGAGRDHFFHSFQNYFLGVQAIAERRDQFVRFNDVAALNWNVEPQDVWFFTAIWHDVGYGMQNLEKLLGLTVGNSPEDEAANVRSGFLKDATTRDGLRVLSSLTARLLNPVRHVTGWLEPREHSRPSDAETRIAEVYQKNVVRRSHGAFGALRLFRDYERDIEAMDPAQRHVLKQTILLAAVSMPFHDFWFRDQLREGFGGFHVRTDAMPFAALLMFVDSIQDDRRQLTIDNPAVQVLRRLKFDGKCNVSADIELRALRDSNLIKKIIEARDVSAALKQESGCLRFQYPEWMGG